MESPEEATVASYSCNSSIGGDSGEGGGCQHAAAVAAFARRKRTRRLCHPDLPGRETPPEEDYSSAEATEEEEDTAHCLILLAQGARRGPAAAEEKFVSRRFAEAATTAGGKAGYYVYECKTCNKCFPSFQALGGHRASHKKPRLADDLDIVGPPAAAGPTGGGGGRVRVHECSICGLEFASGQALGGHMRRHRLVGPAAAPAPGPVEAAKKEERSVLPLDLNLPAPSEENGSSMVVAFGFAVALVDCHY